MISHELITSVLKRMQPRLSAWSVEQSVEQGRNVYVLNPVDNCLARLVMRFDPQTSIFEFQLGRYGLFEGDYNRFDDDERVVDELVSCLVDSRLREIEYWIPFSGKGLLVGAKTEADLRVFGTFTVKRSFSVLSILPSATLLITYGYGGTDSAAT